MIDVYFWPTPNGKKISIMLEELGLPYTIHPINIMKGDQMAPDFLKISPNNKIPAIIDQEPADGGAPIPIFESGAILRYLAQKTGKFYPRDDQRAQLAVEEWLMWQMGGLGPMAGQAGYFHHFNKGKSDVADERYVNEVARLYGVMERRLDDHDYLAGEYSIADIASWPWVLGHAMHGQNLDDFPNVKAWFERVGARPGVARGNEVGSELRRPAP